MVATAPLKIPSGLAAGLLAGAEVILNDALRLDAASLQEFRKLGRCRVKFTITPLGDTFYLLTGYPLKLSIARTDNPDLSVSGTPPAILRFLRGTANRSVSNSGLSITGNQELAQRLQEIGRQLDIDWEAKLAEMIGSIPAHFAGAKMRELSKALGYVKQNFLQDAEEYLHHESKALPHREEVRIWQQAIERITLGTDELDNRLRRLENILPENNHLQNTNNSRNELD